MLIICLLGMAGQQADSWEAKRDKYTNVSSPSCGEEMGYSTLIHK